MVESVVGALSDYLTVIAFLIGTGSFVLSFYIKHHVSLGTTTRFFQGIVLALVIPAAVILFFGLWLIVINGLYQYHLLIFLALAAPIIVIIFMLFRKSYV
jgi:hypothetical protein